MVVYLDVSTLESLKLILLRISLHSPWSRDGTRREILAVNLSDVSPLLRLTLVDLVDLVVLWPAWGGAESPPPQPTPMSTSCHHLLRINAIILAADDFRFSRIQPLV